MARYVTYQEEVNQLFCANGWRYWSPLSAAGRLMEELGELSREVNRRHGDKRKRSNEPEGSIEEEIGDLIYTLACFANSNGYDLDRCSQWLPIHNGSEMQREPMALLAEVGAHIGIFVGDVAGLACEPRSARNIRIEGGIGHVLHAIERLVLLLGLSTDVAIKRSIDKVRVLDKDCFPDGI